MHEITYQRGTKIPHAGDAIPPDIVVALMPTRAICSCGWEGATHARPDGDPDQLARDEARDHLAVNLSAT